MYQHVTPSSIHAKQRRFIAGDFRVLALYLPSDVEIIAIRYVDAIPVRLRGVLGGDVLVDHQGTDLAWAPDTIYSMLLPAKHATGFIRTRHSLGGRAVQQAFQEHPRELRDAGVFTPRPTPTPGQWDVQFVPDHFVRKAAGLRRYRVQLDELSILREVAA
jgi:hypothetical protein